jgi:hypothetical protein
MGEVCMVIKSIVVPAIGWMIVLVFSQAQAQISSDSLTPNFIADTTYIYQEQDEKEPYKVLHAEPLYIDLIRDLGARKGEREWNVGVGLTDRLNYDEYIALIEYEWAPINRLGLEVELPFTFYSNGMYPNSQQTTGQAKPANRLESLKTAFQYSFFVSEKLNTSLAFGYINELVLRDLNLWGESSLLSGNVYNPFFIAAKRWGNNFHTLLYTGPRIEQAFADQSWHSSYEAHSNIHYMIPGTRNFIGIEFNKAFSANGFDMVLRPQMRLSIADNLLIGIVGGIPVSRENERLGSFIRLIYEPRHKHG